MNRRYGLLDAIGPVLGGVGIVLGTVGVIGLHAQQARNTDAVKAPCSAAADQSKNVLCIVDGELDRRAAARDKKEAAAAAKTRTDVCIVLGALPPSKGTTSLRRDLGCMAAAPAPTPAVTTIVIVPPTGKPSPVPTTTPAGTGHPTPSATRSRVVGTSSPPASQHPTPSPSPSCGLLNRLIGACR